MLSPYRFSPVFLPGPWPQSRAGTWLESLVSSPVRPAVFARRRFQPASRRPIAMSRRGVYTSDYSPIARNNRQMENVHLMRDSQIMGNLNKFPFPLSFRAQVYRARNLAFLDSICDAVREKQIPPYRCTPVVMTRLPAICSRLLIHS